MFMTNLFMGMLSLWFYNRVAYPKSYVILVLLIVEEVLSNYKWHCTVYIDLFDLKSLK